MATLLRLKTQKKTSALRNLSVADDKMLSEPVNIRECGTEFTKSNGIVRQRHNFLRLITLFFNKPVLLAGLRLGITMCVISKYEKLGFFLLLLSVAF